MSMRPQELASQIDADFIDKNDYMSGIQDGKNNFESRRNILHFFRFPMEISSHKFSEGFFRPKNCVPDKILYIPEENFRQEYKFPVCVVLACIYI